MKPGTSPWRSPPKQPIDAETLARIAAELGESVEKFNPYHEPAGSPEGGRFASAPGGAVAPPPLLLPPPGTRATPPVPITATPDVKPIVRATVNAAVTRFPVSVLDRMKNEGWSIQLHPVADAAKDEALGKKAVFGGGYTDEDTRRIVMFNDDANRTAWTAAHESGHVGVLELVDRVIGGNKAVRDALDDFTQATAAEGTWSDYVGRRYFEGPWSDTYDVWDLGTGEIDEGNPPKGTAVFLPRPVNENFAEMFAARTIHGSPVPPHLRSHFAKTLVAFDRLWNELQKAQPYANRQIRRGLLMPRGVTGRDLQEAKAALAVQESRYPMGDRIVRERTYYEPATGRVVRRVWVDDGPLPEDARKCGRRRKPDPDALKKLTKADWIDEAAESLLDPDWELVEKMRGHHGHPGRPGQRGGSTRHTAASLFRRAFSLVRSIARWRGTRVLEPPVPWDDAPTRVGAEPAQKYSPDQPRVPAGDPAGGQWTDDGGGGDGGAAADSPAFKHWFGDSQVTDDAGHPLVVYHSGYFDPENDKVPVIGDAGMHFGTKEAAEERPAGKMVDDFITDATIERDEDSGRWFWSSGGLDSYDLDEEGFDSEAEARANMERVAVEQAENWDGSSDTELTHAYYLRILNAKRLPDLGHVGAGGWAAAIAKAKAEGYDGIVYSNRFEDRGKDSWIAFYPHQIKLVSNQTFDAASEDVTKADDRLVTDLTRTLTGAWQKVSPRLAGRAGAEMQRAAQDAWAVAYGNALPALDRRLDRALRAAPPDVRRLTADLVETFVGGLGERRIGEMLRRVSEVDPDMVGAAIETGVPPMIETAVQPIVQRLRSFLSVSEIDLKFNPYHEPAGSPEGGQFARGPGGSGELERALGPGRSSQDYGRMRKLLDESRRSDAKIEALLPRVVEEGPKTWVEMAGGPAPSATEAATVEEEEDSDDAEEEEAEPTTYTPDDWSTLPTGLQEQTAEKWKEDSKSEFVDSEKESMMENDKYEWEHGHESTIGDAVTKELEEDVEWHTDHIRDTLVELGATEESVARALTAHAVYMESDGSLHFAGSEATQAKNERDFWSQMEWEPADKLDSPPTEKWPPYTPEDFGYEGTGNLPGIEASQPEPWRAIEGELASSLEGQWKAELEKRFDNFEIPDDWVEDSVNEYLDQFWDEKSDKEKFKLAEGYDLVGETDMETGELIEPTPKPSPYASREPPTTVALPRTVKLLEDGEDYQRTGALGRALVTARTQQLFEERGLTYSGINRLASIWSQWKGSSHEGGGLALQLAAQEELGANGRMPASTEARARSWADDEMPGGMKGLQAYVRAQWEVTQYLAKKAGVDHFDVFRGIGLPVDQIERHQYGMNPTPDRFLQHLPDIKLQQQGAQSFTAKRGVANDWGPQLTRVVIRARVPREAVLSVPAYGQNVHSEQEVVVAGTPWRAWDAWHRTAPSFSEWDPELHPRDPVTGRFIESTRPERIAASAEKKDDDGLLQYGTDPNAPTIDMNDVAQTGEGHWLKRRPLDRALDDAEAAMKGGPGSGFFGHAGRPGEVGGSAPSGATTLGSGPGDVPTPPANGRPAYVPNPEDDGDGDGVTDAARLGVPGKVVHPPLIPRLPNLSPDERQVEERFASAFERNPEAMIAAFRAQVAASKAPNLFETDAAKMLSPDYAKSDVNRALYNHVLHQTANAIVKEAFVRHLDEVVMKLPPEQRTVLVTSGGCASGKGYALGVMEPTKTIGAGVAAVYDSAGEQNATELPWVLKELQARDIRATFLYVDADPRETIDVAIDRAKNKAGRMNEADAFTDSYAIGARNFDAFAKQHQNDAAFIYISTRGGVKNAHVIHAIPKEAFVSRVRTYAHVISKLIRERANLPAHILRGATAGRRMWHAA